MTSWSQHRRLRSRASFAAILVAAVTSIILTFAPGTQQTAVQMVGPGLAPSQAQVRVTHPSLFDVQGSSVLIPLSIPVALTTLGFAFRRWRGVMVVMAGLMWCFCVIGAASIGLFYVPAHIALVIAIAAPPPRDRKDAAPASA